MENFFPRHVSITEIGKGNWIYSKGYIVKGLSIYDDTGIKVSEIPFIPRHFHALTFEYFLIDDLDTIYLINKNTAEISEIGRVKDGVVSVSISRDESWCVIISTTEILLFDTYIDLKKSIGIEVDNVIRVEWADYGLFAVLTNSMILFYDTELNLVGKSKEGKYIDVSWRGKYNIFGCTTSTGILFVEPNGLEHGNPLDVQCSTLSFLENEDVLITTEKNDGGSLLKVFYTKNFHWYLKTSKQVPGKFLCTEKNTVVFNDGERLVRVFLFEERTRYGPEYYVIDGNCILYTDFSEKIIPPPFFSTRIELDGNIIDVFPRKKKGVILQKDKAVIFRWQKDEFFREKTFLLREEFDSVVLFDSFLLLKNRSSFLIKEVSGEREIHISRDLKGDEGEEEDAIGAEGINRISSRLHDALKGPEDIIKCYNFKGKLCLVLENGSVIYDGIKVYSEIDLSQRFEVIIEEDIYVHNGAKLFVNGNVTENIASFLVGEFGVVTVSEGVCKFLFGSKQSICQVDHNLQLLCAVGFRVIGITRHGTLETYTPRIYTLAFVKKLLFDGKYKDAIDRCQRHIIPFGVFLDYDIEFQRFIAVCKDMHLISFFNEALERLGGFDFILESEEVKRFRKIFNSTIALESENARDYFIETVKNDESIGTSSLAHLVGWKSKRDLHYQETCNNRNRKTPTKSCKITICGRRPKDFFNELLLSLSPERNFKFIIFLLVKVNRIDLALLMAKHDLKAGVEYMLSITSTNNIINSVLESCDEGLVYEVMKVCQKDSSDFLSLIHSCPEDLRKFKINDFLENRINALWHLSRTEMIDLEREYIKKHGLIDEALMYETCGLSTREEGYYFNLCAELLPSDKALALFKKAGNVERALEVAVENLYWREALNLYDKENRRGFCELLAHKLVESEKHYEAGQLFEEFLGEPERAFGEYVKAKSMGDALRLCSDDELLIREARDILREKLLSLDDIRRSFGKYRGRLEALEEREDDWMSDTSFSYTENMRESRSTKVKKRPGGKYEKEFVLSKIRDIGLSLIKWRDSTEDLLKVFEKFKMKECTTAHNTSFNVVASTIKAEVDNIFKTEKSYLYDPYRPVIEKPDLSKWC
ncbi:IkappaB kinase complex protein [Encephalitozoon romaleae SJ-2008]|uniref:IkappaB kinase complex protein n=1 Tax=Encephalitozoon romaleae (strain SJ-2008) TaxID=1178016 RepID=I7APL4_ENCRO|nr:IkappaB kinase complex protein [Encephalitozoon romaleae SJ-2008]AFN83804.1 IkappaB kinase complex protein [Encephalitozoon romaleae SJ-2008]